MNDLLTYLVKASVAMALFYAIYWFTLRKETFFAINRAYLLVALLLSVVMPLFPLTYTVWVQPGQPFIFEAITDAFLRQRPVEQMVAAPMASSGFTIGGMLMVVWGAVSALLLLQLLIQSGRLALMIVRAGSARHGHARLVMNSRYPVPFSFFRYIFINPAIHSGSDLTNIIAHEKVHIRGMHWIDLVMAELLTAAFWFNPFVWWFRRSIRQNHEYLADEGVLAQGCTPGRYQALIINQLMGIRIIGLANPLNFSANTTRFNMMTKMKSRKIRAARMAWALPAVAALLLAFARPEHRLIPAETDADTFPVSLPEQGTTKINGVVLKPDGSPLHGASIVLGGTTSRFSTGTISGADGSFSLEIPAKGHSTLFFSFVGYETHRHQIDPDKQPGDSPLSITMKEGVFNIDPARHFVASPPPPPAPDTPTGSSSDSSPPPPPATHAPILISSDTPPPPPPPPPVLPSELDAVKDVEEIFTVVEEMPEYPGGFSALGQYVKSTVTRQKEKAFFEGKDLDGNALVGFIVNENGEVSNIHILKSDNQAVADAATALANWMATWKPGKQRGKAVPVKMTLPVSY